MGWGRRENSACLGPILHMLKGILFLLASCRKVCQRARILQSVTLNVYVTSREVAPALN